MIVYQIFSSKSYYRGVENGDYICERAYGQDSGKEGDGTGDRGQSERGRSMGNSDKQSRPSLTENCDALDLITTPTWWTGEEEPLSLCYIHR